MQEVKNKNNREESESDLIDDLKIALLHEFPELSRCARVDVKVLWADDGGKMRCRVNGWKSVDSLVGGDSIVFSRFVTAWEEEKGVQYEILS